MLIREIKRYSELWAAGDATLGERLDLLIRHQQILHRQTERMKEHQVKLDEKIQFYRGEIERRGLHI